MKPLVSVIWNGIIDQSLAVESISSIIYQDYSNIEILIKQQLFNKLSDKISKPADVTIKAVAEENATISAYRNQAIKEASGKYVCFLSSPHIFSENRITRQVEYFESHPDIYALLGGETKINSQGETVSLPAFVETDPDYISCALKYGYKVSLYSMMFVRKKIIDGECHFDFSDNSEENFIARFSELFSISGLQGDYVKLYGQSTNNHIGKKIIQDSTEGLMNIGKQSFMQRYNMQIAYRNSLLRFQTEKGKNRQIINEIGRYITIKYNEQRPLVSVIIPTYNRGDRIVRAIESVLNQTYNNIEIIVVDDGSTDDTSAVVKQLALIHHQVKYVYQNNHGPASARNLGAKKANGSYIAFHDDDDEWYCDKLDIQMDRMLYDPSIDMTFGQMARFDGKDLVNVVLSDFDWYNRRRSFFQEELKNNYIGTPTIVIKRNKFVELGGFCEELTAFEDWEFAIRASRICKIEYINTPLMEVNILKQSVTHNVRNSISALIYIIQKYYSCAEDGAELLNLYRKHLREVLKHSDKIDVELDYFKENIPDEFFDSELAKAEYFDIGDYHEIINLEKLSETVKQQQRELQKQTDRNNKLTDELQKQTDRNDKITSELQKQAERNDKLTSELKMQADRNDELTGELQKQADRNDELTGELHNQFIRNNELTEELQKQYDRNEEIMRELERQYERNKKLSERLKQKENN